MTDQAVAGGNGGAQPQESAAPRLAILTQYVKDMSFENPKAPRGMQANAPRPEIQIRVDVNAQPMMEGHFEVALHLNVEARAGEDTVFLMELSYGGVFLLTNIDPKMIQPFLLIECPRLLFPFARRVVADATRDGGFPPLMIDPIDFMALYQRRVQQQQQEAQPPGNLA